MIFTPQISNLGFFVFHLKQRELRFTGHQRQRYKSMGGDAKLQFQSRPQQSPKIDDWQKWQQDSAAKLLQLQAIWDVFTRLQIVDGNVDLQSLLESLQSSWEQPQQSPNRGQTMKIRTSNGSYLVEMKVCVYSLKLSLCLNIDDDKSTITTWHEDEFQFDYEKILEK